MCTSFAVYTSRPLYGMNFDFPEAEVKFKLEQAPAGAVFHLAFVRDGREPIAAGMNTLGFFAAAQILVAHFDVDIQPAEEAVSPYDLFLTSLRAAGRVNDVLLSLNGRRLRYAADRKGHQFYADRLGRTCIMEPGPDRNRIYPAETTFNIMTNRPYERERARAADHLERLGLDRFQIASQIIQARLPEFGIGDGFEVLRQTSLSKGRFTTLCSIVCDPLGGEVFIALRRNYTRIWKLNLQEGSLATQAGFRHPWQTPVNEMGVSAYQLQALAETAASG